MDLQTDDRHKDDRIHMEADWNKSPELETLEGCGQRPMCQDGGWAYVTRPLSTIIQSDNLAHHLYVDDKQIYIYVATPDACYTLNLFKGCLQDASLVGEKQ